MSIADMGMKGEFCKGCPAGGSDEGCAQLTYRPKTVSPDRWIEGHPLHVILSGFIGRIDNYSKRRLGRDIEQRIEALGIKLG